MGNKELENKELLKKILKFNSKMNDKYGYLIDKWWRVPEEDYLYAQIGTRIYTGYAVVLWILCSFILVFDVIFFFSQQTTSVIACTIFAIIFGLYGWMQLNKSNNYKKIYEIEKQKFDMALRKRPETDQKLKSLLFQTEKDVAQVLHKGLTKADTFRQFISTLDELLIIVKQAQQELKHIYQNNKVYDYNLYEPKEVEAFKDVDSYITFEECNQQLYSILETALNCREYAEQENENQFRFSLEKLLHILPEIKNEE